MNKRNKKITISKSFDEAEDKQLQYWANLSTEERFNDFYELMHRFYNFSNHTWVGKKIIIDRYEP